MRHRPEVPLPDRRWSDHPRWWRRPGPTGQVRVLTSGVETGAGSAPAPDAPEEGADVTPPRPAAGLTAAAQLGAAARLAAAAWLAAETGRDPAAAARTADPDADAGRRG